MPSAVNVMQHAPPHLCYFPIQNRSKMCPQNIVRCALSRELIERRASALQVGEHELLRRPGCPPPLPPHGAPHRPARAARYAAVCHRRRVAQRLATGQDIAQPRTQLVEALTCPRRDLDDGRLSFERQRPACPARRLVHLIHRHETLQGGRLLQHRPIFLVERLRSVDHDDRGRRDAQRLTRPGHAFNSTASPADRIPAESMRVTASPFRSVTSVTRSRVVPAIGVTIARDTPSNLLKRLGLTHVRLPHDDNLTSFADQPPSRRPVPEHVDLPPDDADRLGDFSRPYEVIPLLRKIPATPPAWRSGRTTGCPGPGSALWRCPRAGRTRRAPATASPRR